MESITSYSSVKIVCTIADVVITGCCILHFRIIHTAILHTMTEDSSLGTITFIFVIGKTQYLKQTFWFCNTLFIPGDLYSLSSQACRICLPLFVLLRYQKSGVIHDHVKATFNIKGMEHVPNIFMSFDKYLVLEVINILI